MKYLLIMLMAASSVFAQDYVKVHENTKAVFYVDKASIVKEKDVVVFIGKAEATNFTSITEFGTNCKSYVVLSERYETPEEIFIRKKKNPVSVLLEKDSPLEAAVNYVCYNTIKKSTVRVGVPQTE